MMDELVKFVSLKEKFDEIDNDVIDTMKRGFYNSHFKKNIGMWEKGEAIAGVFRGAETPINYKELQRQTGRDNEALKLWHALYEQHPNKQKYIEEYAKPTAEKALNRYMNTLMISQSKDIEWWTPKEYIKAVYKVMREIDLDPASCKEANEIIKAKKYYTEENNGLSKGWKGRIFLNPPYGEKCSLFINKFFEEKEITEAIILVNSNSTDSGWFQPLFNGTLCFTNHRIDFNSPDQNKSSSTHGSCFIYFGSQGEKFAEIFKQFGTIVKKWS